METFKVVCIKTDFPLASAIAEAKSAKAVETFDSLYKANEFASSYSEDGLHTVVWDGVHLYM